MVFNSSVFLVFFIIFFIVYWFINNKLNITIRNIFTIVASYVFYGWWDWRFLSLIIISSTVDYVLGLLIYKSSDKYSRKLYLIISLTANLGILGFFKYFNFFVESFGALMQIFSLNVSTATLKIILPVGISFYTFQTLSYTIDVYRKKINATLDIFSFFSFVAFFPQLVAGPIERASHLLKQFQERKVFSYDDCIAGLRLVLWGFFKKIVIADNFGVLSDAIFDPQCTMSGLLVIVGSIFFAFQIYADFSGYSDIAIGISRMLGFDIMKNFATPYFSESFSEFWRRWHVSLSTWFRDYLYIPLGGNRSGNIRTYFNLLITFLLSGLWHGANITFIIWGALHGLALMIEKRFKIKYGGIYTFLVIMLVILFWIPFRAANFHHLEQLFYSLIHFSSYSIEPLFQVIAGYSIIRFLVLIALILVFLGFEFNMKTKDFNEWVYDKNKWLRIFIYYSLLIAILLMGNFSVKPNFIYFQF